MSYKKKKILFLFFIYLFGKGIGVKNIGGISTNLVCGMVELVFR